MKRGITQKQLATKFKISESAVGMYERGEREPPLDLISGLADFFDVTVDWLLGRTNDPKRTVTDEMEMDIKNMIEAIKEGKALWGGRELNEEERVILIGVLHAVLEREKKLVNEEKESGDEEAATRVYP